MIPIVGLNEWKQAMEGMRCGTVPPMVRRKTVIGSDEIIRYFDGDELVMEMSVFGAGELPAYEAVREFRVASKISSACSIHYIPTDEEIEAWADLENETGEEHIAPNIAARSRR